MAEPGLTQLPEFSVLLIQVNSRLVDLLGSRVFHADLPIALAVDDWPPGASRNDWILAIFRRCKRANLPLTVVSNKRWLTNQASALNIPVFESMELAKEHLKSAKPTPWVRVDKESKGYQTKLAPPGTATQMGQRLSWFSLFASAFLTVCGAGILYLFVVLVLPTATVTVHPAIQHLEVSIPMTASLAVEQPDNDLGLVPGRYVSAAQEISRTGPTSSRKLLPTETSTGLLLAINQTQEPVIVPEGTEVQTGTGQAIGFVTTETVTVPGNSQFQQPIAIEAIEPGETGNVPSNSITKIAGTFGFQLWITNPQPTLGGASDFLKVVSQADIDLLQAQLLAEVEASALDILANELSAAEWLPPAALNVDLQWASTDFFVAEETDELTMTMMVDLSGIAVDTNDMVDYVVGQVAQHAPAGGELLPASLDLSLQPNPEWTGTELAFSVSAAVDYIQDIRQDQIRKAIVGLTPEAALEKLAAWSPEGTPEVMLFPSTQQVLPRLAKRIRILTHVPT